MKTKYFFILIVLGVLILVSGCTEKELGLENEWRLAHSGKGKQWATNTEIVFEPGDKCSLTIYKDATKGSFAYKILIKDDKYDNYIVAIDTLDEGYTIEDQKAHTSPSVGRVLPISKGMMSSTQGAPPFWVDLSTLKRVNFTSRAWFREGMNGKLSMY